VIHAEVSRVRRAGQEWRVEARGQTFSSRTLVLACPAHVSGRLLESAAMPLAAELSAIPYTSAVLVMLVYERAGLGHPLNGFGFLVPRGERKALAAATWVNIKFPSRIPAHLAALRGFIVGSEAASLLDVPDSNIVDLVRQDFSRWMGITATPLFTTVHRWPHSMPQYVVGHQRRRKEIARLLEEYPGLFLTGNAYDGVGIPDCLRGVQETAKRISESCI
jgi:oxygen-dependent protoporphyrinogen oxidase